MPRPASLRIEECDGGFYLQYLDADGEEMTDTWHETLDQTFEQAEWEFTVTRPKWTMVAA